MIRKRFGLKWKISSWFLVSVIGNQLLVYRIEIPFICLFTTMILITDSFLNFSYFFSFICYFFQTLYIFTKNF